MSSSSNETSSHLIAEQLSRNRQFFGDKGQDLIENAFVIVVGLGGVGSHAAHMLARAGVKKMRLIDFDNVTLSSLNRHAVATRKDVGIPKVEACKQHFERIIPNNICKIEAVNRMFTKQASSELLRGNPDFVLDCIDDTDTKSDLIIACRKMSCKFVVSLGAGAKADPTRVHISDISDALADPLGVKIRLLLKQKGIKMAKYSSALGSLRDGIPVVYSSEKASRKLLELTPEQKAKGADHFGAVDNFRVRIMPVLGTLPAIFGMTMASYVLTSLAKQEFVPSSMDTVSKNVSHTHLQRYKKREPKEYGVQTCPLDEKEAGFIIGQLWRQRCAYSGVRLGSVNSIDIIIENVNNDKTVDVRFLDGTNQLKRGIRRSQLLDPKTNKNIKKDVELSKGMQLIAQCKGQRFTMTRWDRSRGATVDNMLFLTEDMAKLHEEATLKTGTVPQADGGLIFGEENLKWIRMTLCLAKASSKEVVDGICEGKQTVSSDEKRSGEYGGTAVSSLTVGASAFAAGIVIGMYLVSSYMKR
eukprot:g7705.t1